MVTATLTKTGADPFSIVGVLGDETAAGIAVATPPGVSFLDRRRTVGAHAPADEVIAQVMIPPRSHEYVMDVVVRHRACDVVPAARLANVVRGEARGPHSTLRGGRRLAPAEVKLPPPHPSNFVGPIARPVFIRKNF